MKDIVMPPKCCDQRSQGYQITYGHQGTEQGFRCLKCKRIRLPFKSSWNTAYMDSLEILRLAGIAFDESLAN